MKLRKPIMSTFKKYLSESYNNINELNILTKDLIHIIANNITRKYSVLDNEYIIQSPFDEIDIEKYQDIKGFLIDSFIDSISVSDITHDTLEGVYYDNKIKFFIEPSVKNLKILSSRDNKRIYYLINGSFYVLLHELQHAYDDYRSNGKYNSNKVSNYNYNNAKDLETYFRTNHELNAHFTENISRIVFYTTDYKETPTSLDDGIVIVIRKINDFDIIKQNFIKNFKGWRYLTKDIKKKMLHRLGKYYIEINEKIQKYNQEKHTKNFY